MKKKINYEVYCKFMKVKDLCEKFNVTLPKTLTSIELEEETDNFTEYKEKNKVHTFKGEYEPNWFEGNKKLEVIVEIDLTIFNDETIQNLGNGWDWITNLELDERQNLIAYETLMFTKAMKNNFKALQTYNILGDLIRIS